MRLPVNWTPHSMLMLLLPPLLLIGCAPTRPYVTAVQCPPDPVPPERLLEASQAAPILIELENCLPALSLPVGMTLMSCDPAKPTSE